MYTTPVRHIKQAYVFDKVREAEALGVYNENIVKEAKEEFDRALENLWEEAVTYGHNSRLNLVDKLNNNPYSTETFKDRWIKARMADHISNGNSHDHLEDEVEFEYACRYENINVTLKLTKTRIKGSWTDIPGEDPVTIHYADMPYSVARSLITTFEGKSNFDGNGVEVSMKILDPHHPRPVAEGIRYYAIPSDFAIDYNLREG